VKKGELDLVGWAGIMFPIRTCSAFSFSSTFPLSIRFSLPHLTNPLTIQFSLASSTSISYATLSFFPSLLPSPASPLKNLDRFNFPPMSNNKLNPKRHNTNKSFLITITTEERRREGESPLESFHSLSYNVINFSHYDSFESKLKPVMS